MRILYVFPHPDDESFGPARGIAAQVGAGHEVYLLTLTRGGATKERHRYGYTVEQMGEIRAREMRCVADVLGLSGLTVLDLPDGGLKELDPGRIETAIERQIAEVRPRVVVTYPVHGVSGFADHLVTHAAVKAVYRRLRARGDAELRRLAMATLTEAQAEHASGVHRLSSSTEDEIDCLLMVGQEEMAAFRAALDCYVTYREMIERTGVAQTLDHRVAYEFFGEAFDPPVADLCAGLS
jgi:LmbE family N-acetylglucosaminyl deacetylase